MDALRLCFFTILTFHLTISLGFTFVFYVFCNMTNCSAFPLVSIAALQESYDVLKGMDPIFVSSLIINTSIYSVTIVKS